MVLRSILLLSAGIACALLVACDDPTIVACDPCPQPPPGYQNLTERWHVLHNLQLSYNKRNVSKYDELLDANFTFFFDPGDVGGGIPAQWGRAEDVAETRKLFEQTESPICLSIDLDVEFEDGVQWVEVFPDPDQFPGEVWQTAEVFYNFTFVFDDGNTYVPYTGSKAQFTVRQVDDVADGRKEWRLVQWRDVGGDRSLHGPAAAASGENGTWGGIKAMYR